MQESVKVRAGGTCELVDVDAGVRVSLGLMPLAMESLDTVLDWKRRSSEWSVLYFKQVTHEKWRLERKETKSLQNILE